MSTTAACVCYSSRRRAVTGHEGRVCVFKAPRNPPLELHVVYMPLFVATFCVPSCTGLHATSYKIQLRATPHHTVTFLLRSFVLHTFATRIFPKKSVKPRKTNSVG